MPISVYLQCMQNMCQNEVPLIHEEITQIPAGSTKGGKRPSKGTQRMHLSNSRQVPGIEYCNLLLDRISFMRALIVLIWYTGY